MPRLRYAETRTVLGDVTAEQLAFLVENIVQEDPSDREFYLDRDSLEVLVEAGCPEELKLLLEKALEGREDVDLVWGEEEEAGGEEQGPYR